MTTKRASVESTADAYLELLAARGVEYFFANSGTDFAPLIDAYARRLAQGLPAPRPMTIPHEVPAVGMAHGYALVTGRPQVVMVHVIVGAGNAVGGIINAARSNVPILFSAGRNPITESGMHGSRNRPIHWAQESFDQAGMIREFVKWDYELRNFSQLETVVDRALAVSQAEPQGPVYLTLPREVLAEKHDVFEYTETSRAPKPGAVVAAPEAVAEAAKLLTAARNPIILTKAAGRDPQAVPALVKLAEALGAPVFDQFHTYMNFPQDHPLHAGFDAAPYLDDADCVVAVESDVLWFPALKAPRPETKIVQIAVDPLYARYPIRGFPADSALSGTVRTRARSPSARSAGTPSTVVCARRGRQPRARRRAKIRSRWCGCRSASATSWTRTRSWSTSTISIRRRAASARREATSAPRRPAASAGAWARRWAPSWPPPTRPSSAASATAPTSSARRPRRTSSRAPTTCPCCS
jgi:acetolactate synthase-1/2/3 large subunit